MSKIIPYVKGSMSAKDSAVVYCGTKDVCLPDGTKFECKSFSEASALCQLINILVVSQTTPKK